MSTLALLEGKSLPLKEKPYNAIAEEELEAATAVMRGRALSGFVGRAGEHFLGGERVRQLESDFQKFFGVKHAVTFNSATTALQAAVAALDIGPGDEVITSPFTMAATPAAILLNGAVPVFADIDPVTYCLDLVSVRARLTPRTKAIFAVNIFGGCADYDELRKIADERGLKIIEDNAQGPGATYRGKFAGTIGDVGVFSLNVHKVIQCGEGGVLVTNDDRAAYRAQLVRNHGEVVNDDLADQEPFEALIGSNYRMSELHAAVAIEQLKKLNALNDIRREQAAYLTERLSSFSWIAPCAVPDHMKHVYYIYPFRILAESIGLSRATVVKALTAEGFRFNVGYQKPLYLLRAYQEKRMFTRSQFPFVSSEFPTDVSYNKGLCPVAERMYERELLTTTIFQPPNGQAEIDALIDALRRIDENVTALKSYEAQG